MDESKNEIYLGDEGNCACCCQVNIVVGTIEKYDHFWFCPNCLDFFKRWVGPVHRLVKMMIDVGDAPEFQMGTTSSFLSELNKISAETDSWEYRKVCFLDGVDISSLSPKSRLLAKRSVRDGHMLASEVVEALKDDNVSRETIGDA